MDSFLVINARLRANDPTFSRLDITAPFVSDMCKSETGPADFISSMALNRTVHTVHLSGLGLQKCLPNDSTLQQVLQGVGALPGLQELFVFCGNCSILTETVVAHIVQSATNLKVLMMWGFALHGGDRPQLAGALRHHQKLQRITLTLTADSREINDQDWSCLDVYVMGLASMTALECLQIRCQGGKQGEALISPEAITLLMNSESITSLYLENVGLLDDHVDAICYELGQNRVLKHLDLKGNHFSDDALYTFARYLPKNKKLTSLDLSGVALSQGGGKALAASLEHNTVIQFIELEGTAERYQDEFHIPVGHSEDPWMHELNYRLRLNRANNEAGEKVTVKECRKRFVEALVSVNDHLECLYHFVRRYPAYCEHYGTTVLVLPSPEDGESRIPKIIATSRVVSEAHVGA